MRSATRRATATRLFRRLVPAILGLTLLGVAPAEAGTPAAPAAGAASAPTRDRLRMNQRVFDRVWTEVQREYYDPTIHGLDWRAQRDLYRPQALAARDDRELYAALDGMLDLLDDDHAGAAPPAVVRRQAGLREQRPVMGLTLYPEDDGVYRIERVRAGSPAAEARIGLGWRLETLNGASWSPEVDVVDGQPVSLRFLDQAGLPRDVTLTPRQMEPQPAFTADRSRPGVLVLRVEGFERGLGRWMGAQLADLPAETDVVLDLRANPGGLLMEADAVLSCFLPRDLSWATRTSRTGRATSLKIRPACGDLQAPATNDLAVLVSRTSRSAAELTPAALQEADRAVVVGQRTAGAVLISQDTSLPDGGRLTLSRADFVTAGGVRLEKRGVDPDIAVSDATAPADSSDPALEAALVALRASRDAHKAL